jgi:hypothetical protein
MHFIICLFSHVMREAAVPALELIRFNVNITTMQPALFHCCLTSARQTHQKERVRPTSAS